LNPFKTLCPFFVFVQYLEYLGVAFDILNGFKIHIYVNRPDSVNVTELPRSPWKHWTVLEKKPTPSLVT